MTTFLYKEKIRKIKNEENGRKRKREREKKR